MNIPKLTIGSITSNIPIIQGAMGVRVSLSSLSSAVANEGGIGTIASVGLGDIEASKNEYEKMSREALEMEILKAKSLSDGHIAVNIMGVLSNADDLVRTAVREGIKIIVFGAGLPLKLPALIEDNSVNLLPIISSGRAAELILRSWDRRFRRTTDGIIVEGPLAGGHLGFSYEQLSQPEKYSLNNLLPEILDVVKPYEDKYERKIPVIVAGGIFDGNDIARMLSLGASGVQMATRFVCTVECDVSQEFKEEYLHARKEDIIIIKSPVGLPGRAIRNQFLRSLEIQDKFKINCPYRCLRTCNVKEAKYCIAQALLNASFGDVASGLIFSGQNAYRITKITTVKNLISELLAELKASDLT
jgi:NAD(P)H-dependent flavin oxidoreductase YrpB (nitropropane dioxygenase family)